MTRLYSVTDSGVTDSFPRQYVWTQRLTLGEPRNIVVSPDGKRIVFVRSRGRQPTPRLPLDVGRHDR